jgi:hypothetical protein
VAWLLSMLPSATGSPLFYLSSLAFLSASPSLTFIFRYHVSCLRQVPLCFISVPSPFSPYLHPSLSFFNRSVAAARPRSATAGIDPMAARYSTLGSPAAYRAVEQSSQMPEPLEQQVWASNQKRSRRLNSKRRRKQRENQAVGERKRLKCERQKERRDEKKTIMWMNEAIAAAESAQLTICDSAGSYQSHRRWGKGSRSKLLSGDVLYLDRDFEQVWFDCMATGTEPNLHEFLPNIESASNETGSVHWRTTACLQAQRINISDILTCTSPDGVESESTCGAEAVHRTNKAKKHSQKKKYQLKNRELSTLAVHAALPLQSLMISFGPTNTIIHSIGDLTEVVNLLAGSSDVKTNIDPIYWILTNNGLQVNDLAADLRNQAIVSGDTLVLVYRGLLEDPIDPCLVCLMDNDSENEQSVVTPCFPSEHYVDVNAALLDFSIKLAAALQQRNMCFSDIAKDSPKMPCRFTSCQLAVLTMVAHCRDLSKLLRVPFEGPPSCGPSSTQRLDTVKVRRLVDKVK